MDINTILNPVKNILNQEPVMESWHNEYDEDDDYTLAMEAALDGVTVDVGIDPDLGEDEDMTTDEYVNSIPDIGEDEPIDEGLDSDLGEDEDISTDDSLDL